MSDALLTAADVAAKLKDVSAEWVVRMTRAEDWPCVKFSSRTIRYRPEHVDEILARYDSTPAPVRGLAGQTERSRRRAS